MHRVRRTKHPSFRQIRNMAANLKGKYGKEGSIQTTFFFYNLQERFWISANGSCGVVDTWQEFQEKYRELMRRK